MSKRSVCIYAGSALGVDPAHAETAARLGGTLADAGYRLVYGGGGIGVMGACARAAYQAGGEVLGVIPRFLVGQEKPIAGVPTVVVESMHERKRRMLVESDAFLALPGGVGTLEELIETLSWARLGLHGKPVMLVGAAFWSPLVALFAHMQQAGFAPGKFAECWRVVEEAEVIAALDVALAEVGGPVFDSARLT